MTEDPTIQLGIIGIFTAVISTAGVVLVALINNRKERSGSAEQGIVVTLRERILLRDEQIEALEEENQSLKQENQALKEKHDQS